MKFITTTANDLELKYFGNPNYDYQLLWNYIGPNKTHGDLYDSPRILWIEVIDDNRQSPSTNSGTPIGVFALTENMHLSFSLHLSVLEVLEKKMGYGSSIMDYILKMARDFGYKYFTLFPHNAAAKEFYIKCGLEEHQIGKLGLMGKVL
jgi:hypothetical protein